MQMIVSDVVRKGIINSLFQDVHCQLALNKKGNNQRNCRRRWFVSDGQQRRVLFPESEESGLQWQGCLIFLNVK